VFTTDWHVSDQPPGRRTKSYREEILAKVHFAIDYANRIKAVSLCGGDIYHVKNARNVVANSHALQTRLEEELHRAYLGTVFGVHGNHDIWADRADSIPTQPLGALVASGAFTDVSSESVIFENRDGSVRVQVDAYPYDSDDIAALNRVLTAPPREPGVTYRVVLMHQYGDPETNPSLFGHPTISWMKLSESDYDLALWGHDHSRVEPTQIGTCTHVRLGSLSRASLASDEVDRPINAAVFAFLPDELQFKELPLPAKPLEVAFTRAAIAVEKVHASDGVTEFFEEMDAQVSGIESTNPRSVVVELCAGDKELEDCTLELCGL
jgi:DNA repair exonuclease SbcCD nuclease subunit